MSKSRLYYIMHTWENNTRAWETMKDHERMTKQTNRARERASVKEKKDIWLWSGSNMKPRGARKHRGENDGWHQDKLKILYSSTFTHTHTHTHTHTISLLLQPWMNPTWDNLPLILSLSLSLSRSLLIQCLQPLLFPLTLPTLQSSLSVSHGKLQYSLIKSRTVAHSRSCSCFLRIYYQEIC